MKALDRKLLRDLVRLWAQALAIALVLAAGVATLVLAVGAARSLTETRDAYYERYRFAQVFASATRAPEAVAAEIAEIPGVSAVAARIVRPAILDVADARAPVTATVISLPEGGQPRLNALYLREGRLPDPLAHDEAVVSASFADAHGIGAGDTFAAVMEGRRNVFRITGTALSPEYIYALGPGDVVPDDRRFGVVWIPRAEVEAAYDLEGAFNNVAVGLSHGADEAQVIADIDALLARYGGAGAYGREDQTSHAFLDSELTALRNLSRVIPPIFLAVAAFLVNITIARLIALERELIGLMKALGYSTVAVMNHYLKLAALIAVVGVVIGWGLGLWLGRGLTELYGEFYRFPFLIFLNKPDVYLISGAAAVVASLAGAANAIWTAARLPPAVAMAPPAPPRFKQAWFEPPALMRRLPQAAAMAVRNIGRRPVRSALTLAGLALSIAVLIGSLFATDSIEFMIDATYFRADRQDATLTFAEEKAPRALIAAARLPGVMAAEPARVAAVRLVNGVRRKRTALTGKPPDADLSRVVGLDLEPVALPSEGIALSASLAADLGVGRGGAVRVEVLEGRRQTLELPVTAIIQQYFGQGAYMSLDEMNRTLGDGPRIDLAHLALDSARLDEFYAAVKETPAVAAVALHDQSLRTFRDTMARNIDISTTVYTALAMVIGFGVVYNAARIQLSERARELASLRVLGFSRGETSRILLAELVILAVAALPLGWALGHAIAWAVVQGLKSDLFRVPLIIGRDTYGLATLAFFVAFAIAAALVRRRVDALDLVAVLKTRE